MKTEATSETCMEDRIENSHRFRPSKLLRSTPSTIYMKPDFERPALNASVRSVSVNHSQPWPRHGRDTKSFY